MWKSKTTRRILFFCSILVVFSLSYLRYTYFINPNISGEPFIIKIAWSGIKYKENSKNINENQNYLKSNTVIARSIVVFWFLFGLTNSVLFYSWRGSRKDLVFNLVIWIGLTFIIITFAGLHFILKPEDVFFGLFTKIKNFMLSLLYTGVIFIFAKFFNRIVREE